MAKTRSRRRKAPTPEQRQAKREAQRERMERACKQLLTSEGWKRWVRLRATNGLSRYSRHNQFLLALQAMERKLELSYVAGFNALRELGYEKREGEKPLWVLAPRSIVVTADPGESRDQKQRNDETVDENGVKRRLYFRAVRVYDVGQCEPIPGAEVADLTPPSQPVDGDSHEHLIAELITHASSLGYEVEERELDPSGPGGWCDHKAKQIVYGSGPANRRVRVLVHELAHAHGVTYTEYTREQAEVIVDTVTHIVLSSVGLDVSGETVPYVAGWGEDGALEAIQRFAAVIDETARKLEDALMPERSETTPREDSHSAEHAEQLVAAA